MIQVAEIVGIGLLALVSLAGGWMLGDMLIHWIKWRSNLVSKWDRALFEAGWDACQRFHVDEPPDSDADEFKTAALCQALDKRWAR